MPRLSPTTLIPATVLVLAIGCSEGGNPDAPPAAAAGGESYEEELRLALETARPGDVIEIPAGTHEMTRSLTLNTDGITIRGAGMEESVLSFSVSPC